MRIIKFIYLESMYGVTSLPVTPLASASAKAVCMAAASSAPEAASAAGMGTASRMPDWSPNSWELSISLHTFKAQSFPAFGVIIVDPGLTDLCIKDNNNKKASVHLPVPVL